MKKKIEQRKNSSFTIFVCHPYTQFFMFISELVLLILDLTDKFI